MMKFRTLECFCEVVAGGFSFSHAARTLRATQPAISRQIQLLEEELGFAVFERRGARVLKLTLAGQAVFDRAQKVLTATREIGLIRPSAPDVQGTLTIATTEFNARYTLLPVLSKYRSLRPHISLSILSVDPSTAAQLVIVGKADVGLATSTADVNRELVSHKCLEVDRVVIVPRGHPLTREKRLTLAKIAAYPLILYDTRLSGGRRVLDTFNDRGIKVQVALSATTADAIKAYVAEGIGVGIVQARAVDRKKDNDIVALKATKLFGVSPVFVFFRRNALLRTYLDDFVSLLMPAYDRLSKQTT